MHLLAALLMLLGPTPVERADALDVLRAWDADRAAAYAAGDRDGLADLYTAGSGAGAADVAVLDDYRRRGLTVWQRSQVFDAQVLASRTDRIRLRVTDRTVTVIGDGVQCRSLPTTLPMTRDVEFVLADEGWRVVSVRAAPSPAPR